MSRALISHSADLRRLRDEGYSVQIQHGLLIVRDVPYVDADRRVRAGTLISSLNLAGDTTTTPDTHVVHFDGDFPCGSDGARIQQIAHQSQHFDFGTGLTAEHSFSSKPAEGYRDYHHKMTTYIGILSGPAEVVDPEISPRIFRTPEEEQDQVFQYLDTASGRAGIGAVTELLSRETVAIIGLGGTGSYVLDLVAKTPVREIHLFDGDDFLQHNAFRAPGAPTIEELRDRAKKVDYFRSIYSRMRRGIVAHAAALDEGNTQLLDGVTFAFVCMDSGDSKRSIVDKLEQLDVPFVDVGMGVDLSDGKGLGGILRVTASTAGKRDHRQSRIPFSRNEEDDVYSSNIQVADLNALNAAMAVIKWKKILGFYRDLEREHHSTYTIDGNTLDNSEQDGVSP